MRTFLLRHLAFLLLLSMIGGDIFVLCTHCAPATIEKVADAEKKDAKEDSKDAEDDCKPKKDEDRPAPADFALPLSLSLAKRFSADSDVAASLTYLATFTPPPERANC